MYRRLFVSVNPFHARHVRESSSEFCEPQFSFFPYTALLLSGTSCRTFYDGVRQLRGVSLYLDTQGEFALPARDYRVEASVSGWYNRLQQSRLAAPGCPACTPGWTPQPQGTYTYRLEARVARFYAAWPALRGFRSSGGPSASVAHFRQSG